MLSRGVYAIHVALCYKLWCMTHIGAMQGSLHGAERLGDNCHHQECTRWQHIHFHALCIHLVLAFCIHTYFCIDAIKLCASSCIVSMPVCFPACFPACVFVCLTCHCYQVKTIRTCKMLAIAHKVWFCITYLTLCTHLHVLLKCVELAMHISISLIFWSIALQTACRLRFCKSACLTCWIRHIQAD